MKNKNKNNYSDIPQEILELLPWYAIGVLSENDRMSFDKALLEYSQLENALKQELQLIKTVSMHKSIFDVSIIASQDERIKSVFNVIDNPKLQIQEQHLNTSIDVQTTSISLKDKIKNVFNNLFPDSESQYALLSVGVLIFSVVVLTSFTTPHKTDVSDFNLASAKSEIIENKQAKTSLLVGFNGSSKELGNNHSLKNKFLKIETTPDVPGIYQVTFKETLSSEEIQTMLNELQKQEELIWFAGEEF